MAYKAFRRNKRAACAHIGGPFGVAGAASNRIEIKRSAAKEIAALSKRNQRRVLSAIEALADDPRPSGVRKLVQSDDAYRHRVGDYRVVYQIIDNTLTVFEILSEIRNVDTNAAGRGVYSTVPYPDLR